MNENPGAAVPSEPTTPREPFDFRSYPEPENLVEWWNGLGKAELWSIEVGDIHNLLDMACEEIERLRARVEVGPSPEQIDAAIEIGFRKSGRVSGNLSNSPISDLVLAKFIAREIVFLLAACSVRAETND